MTESLDLFHLSTMAEMVDQFTPMMRQYRQVKATCPDAILMFRLGDFYEMFEEDARIASQVLDLALTRKFVGGGNTVPLAGIPYHALNNYLFKLTRAGYRVAICEQTEDPKTTKKLVNREIVRTVTPGTLVEAEGMEASENNYLLALYENGLEGCGLAVADISTSEFRATCLMADKRQSLADSTELIGEILKLSPSEIILPEGSNLMDTLLPALGRRVHFVTTRLDPGLFQWRGGEEDPRSLEETGLSPLETRLARQAAAGIHHYVQTTYRGAKLPTLSLVYYRPSKFLGLDPATERNLELVANLRDGGRKGTLLSVLDRTSTAMGGRELRKWILRPLLDLNEIHQRQEAIEVLVQHPNQATDLVQQLKQVKDLERLLSRIGYRTANPRDLKALETSLEVLPQLNQILAALPRQDSSCFSPIDPATDILELLQKALVDEPPVSSRDGGIFREGFHPELDELRQISRGGKGWLVDLQARERERTGIPSLKVSYNKVFGYYIEITKAHEDKVPADYIRKQTLVSAERYITPELKEYENKILTAEDRIKEIEKEEFSRLLDQIAAQGERIQATARQIAILDTLLSLAQVALDSGYCRPEMNLDDLIEIEAGRHPVLEKSHAVQRFVPNDTRLDHESDQVHLITGPNMGGKSTYIRQVALLVLMAQMGSFIPASRARIGIVDRIFSRVGASDNLFEGQSTFMVEMSETALILRNATPRSLVILDEIGRGTATYDGISLAWAIVEYLLRIGKTGVRTLFATHYHEMAELEKQFERVKNYHALVAEQEGKVTFLYQIAPGSSDHSYGIHVAELAGIPKAVTRGAARILRQLESGDFHRQNTSAEESTVQLSLFSLVDEPLAVELRSLNIDELSPIEALQILDQLVRKAKRQ